MTTQRNARSHARNFPQLAPLMDTSLRNRSMSFRLNQIYNEINGVTGTTGSKASGLAHGRRAGTVSKITAPADRRHGSQLPSPVHRQPCPHPMIAFSCSDSHLPAHTRHQPWRACRKPLLLPQIVIMGPASRRPSTVGPVRTQSTSFRAAIRTCLLSLDTCSPTDSRLHNCT